MPNRAYDLENLKDLINAHNGVQTFDFNQTAATHRAGGPPNDGICLSLSCHWLKYHASNDSLVNHIGGVTDRNGHVLLAFKKDEYKALIRWQQRIAAFPDWQMGYKAWIRNQGLQIRSEQTSTTGLKPLHSKLSLIRDGYAMIIMKGRETSCAHAVVAYIGTEDACFFDPNYGEYWFPRRRDFFNFFHFFSAFFYRKSHSHNMGMNEYGILDVYAKHTHLYSR